MLIQGKNQIKCYLAYFLLFNMTKSKNQNEIYLSLNLNWNWEKTSCFYISVRQELYVSVVLLTNLYLLVIVLFLIIYHKKILILQTNVNLNKL